MHRLEDNHTMRWLLACFRAMLAPVLATAAAMPMAVALAQVPNDLFETAATVMQQYARDASEIVPCAIMAGFGDSNPKIVNQWDEVDVRRALDQFVRRYNAAAAQRAALLKVFEENYRPNFQVGDIRTFARSCWDRGISTGLYVLDKKTTPLSSRHPFGP
jgi:hypothetical protein